MYTISAFAAYVNSKIEKNIKKVKIVGKAAFLPINVRLWLDSKIVIGENRGVRVTLTIK